jgi:hypothetical protein
MATTEFDDGVLMDNDSENRCPECGSPDLKWEIPEQHQDEYEYPFVCNNCGLEGAERYTLQYSYTVWMKHDGREKEN